MDVRQFAFLARQPSAALKTRSTFLGLPKRGLALILANAMFWQPLLAQADGIVVSAPGTTLGQAGNGVPIVNIAAPQLAAGCPHNQFPGLQRRPAGRHPQQRHQPHPIDPVGRDHPRQPELQRYSSQRDPQ